MTLRRLSLVLAACFGCAIPFCFGQVDYATATLRGAVLDSQGHAIVGAQVIVNNVATGAVKAATSTENGYLISAIAPGAYRVRAEAKGFATSIADGVILTVGQLTEYDIHLAPSAQVTSVTVQAEIPIVHPGQTQQANIINTAQVENLPNVSRNFVESIYTLPGVVNSYAPTLQNPGVGTAYLSSGFSIGASNGRDNLVTIDGGENDYGSGTMREMHVPIDSIQEFQVNRNAFEAAFGFTSGTAINMVTKSGGNQFHGSAAAYFHDRPLDGGDYFAKLERAGAKPFEQSAIFSATLGGPIRKDHLFFFTAPEYQQLDSATVQDLASEQEFQGIASQTNGYNGSCPNQDTAEQQVTQLCYLTEMANSGGYAGAVGEALLNAPLFGTPLDDPILNALVAPNDGTFDGIPASPSGSGVRGLPGFSTPRGRYFNWVTRLDESRASNAFALRFALMREDDTVAPRPPYSGNDFQTDYTLTGSWTRTIGANAVNTARIQAVPSNTSSNDSPQPNGSEIDLGNEIQLGTPFVYPYYSHFKRFQFDDSFSRVLGNHIFKIGASWRPDEYRVQQKVWIGGNWEFTDGTFSILEIAGAEAAPAVENFNVSEGYPATGPPSTNLTAVQAFLAGTPTVLLQADPNSNDQWSGWVHLLGLYAQDSWKVAPSLTVNYGVRLDYDGEPAPVPSSARVSPRLGIAWNPGRDRSTVVRAGAGIFVAPDTFLIPYYANLLGDSGKYINENALVAGLPSPPFPSIFAAWALARSKATTAFPNPSFTSAELASLGMVIVPPGPAAFGNFMYTMGPGFKPEYSVQASLSIDRQITPNLSLEAAYLMYHSVHVEQILEANFVQDPAVPVDPFVGPYYVPRSGTTAGEPNSSIFQNDAFNSSGSGIYHGATLSLTRRFARNLQFQANYTFSRALDDTSDFSSLSTPFRPGLQKLDRGVSDFNITHNFVANAVYTTPFATSGGWAQRMLANVTVSPIVSARSGVPFTALVPGLLNGTIAHSANARPWREGRNNGTGPRFVSWDMSISKTLFRLHEQQRLEFVAQTQNLLNHSNFASVNNNFPADPSYPLPGGGTLENGPYRLKGFVPDSVAQLSQPLAFISSYPARRVSLAVRFAF